MPWRPSSNSNTSRNGAPPTGNNGFGVLAASAPRRLPRPPHKITACRTIHTSSAAARKSPAGKKALLHKAAYDVPRGYVDLLDQRRRIRRCMQTNVAA